MTPTPKEIGLDAAARALQHHTTKEAGEMQIEFGALPEYRKEIWREDARVTIEAYLSAMPKVSVEEIEKLILKAFKGSVILWRKEAAQAIWQLIYGKEGV